MRILLVDHADSYTQNLAHAIAACTGEAPRIVAHDHPQLLALAEEADAVVLSPGPGSPLHERDAGLSLALIRQYKKSLLGVCLGHQLIAHAWGAKIVSAKTPTHGRTSPILHEGTGLFADLPAGFAAMRYHSLAVADLPDTLHATAHTADGDIMALAHRDLPQLGIQFHPESVGTPDGLRLLANFFALGNAWQEPREIFAKHFVHEPNAFLLEGDGRYAYAGSGALETPDWQALARRRQNGANHFTAGRVGLLPYEMDNGLFIRPEAMMIFDRVLRRTTCIGQLPPARPPPQAATNPRSELTTCSDRTYKDRIAEIRALIVAGEAYELCLTRQITGTTTLTPWQTYLRLAPAPFSAFMQFGERAFVGASPELFLRVDKHGRVQTKPIKGTRKRGQTPSEDQAFINDLATHEKDRAENLMIVDVARHDLGQICEYGSIEAKPLLSVETFAHVHQLVSTVSGQLRDEVSAAQAAQAAFPPASMTGAPKQRAMEHLARLEQTPRGFYSGAYGWFDDSGTCELAVSIRSLSFDEHKVRFGVGGAILLQSDPDSEWAESELKAKATLAALAAERPETP